MRKTFEAVFNGTLGVWRSMSTIEDLTYIEAEAMRSLLYVGSEPDAGQCRDLLGTIFAPSSANKYGLIVGYHNVRADRAEKQLMSYIWKKPLCWVLNGSGLFYWEVPATYNHDGNPAKAAEGNLKSFFLNLRGTCPCDHLGNENQKYTSGEFLTFDCDQRSFQSAVQKLCKVFGLAELVPYTVRRTHAATMEF